MEEAWSAPDILLVKYVYAACCSSGEIFEIKLVHSQSICSWVWSDISRSGRYSRGKRELLALGCVTGRLVCSWFPLVLYDWLDGSLMVG